MRKTFISCAAAAGALAAMLAPAAMAATPQGGDSDAKCLALALLMANAQDPKVRAVGQQAVIYYVGHADGRGGRGDLESRMAAQITGMTQASAQPAAQACVRQMGTRLMAFQTAAQHIAQRFGRPQAPAGPAAPQPASPAPATPTPAPQH